MSQAYTREWVMENLRDMTNCERSRARGIIERESGNFDCFLESLSREERESPLAQAFIEQFELRWKCLGSRFPNLEWGNA